MLDVTVQPDPNQLGTWQHGRQLLTTARKTQHVKQLLRVKRWKYVRRCIKELNFRLCKPDYVQELKPGDCDRSSTEVQINFFVCF